MKRAPCLKGYGVFCYIEKDTLDRILCTEKNTKKIQKYLKKDLQYGKTSSILTFAVT